jgi:hypothetical protein
LKQAPASFALTLVLCVSASSAAAASACPVATKIVRLYDQGSAGAKLVLRVENTSDKRLDAYKFRAILANQTGEEYDYLYDLGDNLVLKPGKSYLLRQSMPTVVRDNLSRKSPIRVYLQRAVFGDGSVWLDDGTKSCVSTQ